jgi:fluoride exporter
MRSSLIIFVGGGVLRHLLNAWIMRLARLEFPLGILTINVIGSTAMGLVAGGFAFKGHAPQDVRLFLTAGILGGFTTCSAFSLDAAILYERGQLGLAVVSVVASVALSVGGLFAGMWTMRSLT